MSEGIPLNNILFIDIETVPQCKSFNDLSPEFKQFWETKSSFIGKEGDSPDETYERAGIYAEFGKIICISVGYIFIENDKKCFKIKSFYGDDERSFLPQFITMLEDFQKKKTIHLCAHNGKEFDFPYLARRILINDLNLPKLLDVAGKKPWEVNFLDTMELWKFGDYKHYTSLNLLTHLFKIPSPKDDIDGSMVSKIYYEDNDLERIVKYCEKDVLAIAQLMLKYRSEEIIKPDNVTSITFQ